MDLPDNLAQARESSEMLVIKEEVIDDCSFNDPVDVKEEVASICDDDQGYILNYSFGDEEIKAEPGIIDTSNNDISTEEDNKFSLCLANDENKFFDHFTQHESENGVLSTVDDSDANPLWSPELNKSSSLDSLSDIEHQSSPVTEKQCRISAHAEKLIRTSSVSEPLWEESRLELVEYAAGFGRDDQTFRQIMTPASESASQPCPASSDEAVRTSESLWEDSQLGLLGHAASLRQEQTCQLPQAMESAGQPSTVTSDLAVEVQVTVGSEESCVIMNSGTINGKRKWDRKDCCIFCEELITNYTRHLIRKHGNKMEVAKILAKPKGSKDRKVMFDRLRKKGNFFHNTKCIRENSGGVIVAQRPQSEAEVSKYLPCKYCFGFFSRSRLYRHMRTCSSENQDNSSRHAQSVGSTMLIVNQHCSEELKSEVLKIMKNDEVTDTVKGDQLICEFGSRLVKKYHEIHFKTVISQKLRELGRLLLCLNSINQSKLELAQFLKPEMYGKVVLGVKELAGYNMLTGTFKTPSLATKLGHTLRVCADILECKGVILSNTSLVESAKQFKFLMLKQWYSEIGIIEANTQDKGQGKDKQQRDQTKRVEGKGRRETNNSMQDKIRKRRKPCTKVPWTEDEKSAVKKHFQKHILLRKLPNKAECDKCLIDEPSLSGRTWSHLKFFVKNSFSKI